MEDLPLSTPSDSADCYQVRRIRNYAWSFVAAWTLLLLASAVLTTRENNASLANLARTEARAAIGRDILYRRWGSSHGGVYIPVTKKSPPSPYLSHLPERDISTPSGKKLTLINPAYMTRQVYDLAKEANTDIGTGHLTSLNPIRPENIPDPWEKKALDSFDKGVREVSEMVKIDGQPFMRLMQAFVTEKSCLKCHSFQGYKEGDIRGGLSVTIPVGPLIEATSRNISGDMAMHGLIWLLGLGMTGLGARQLTRSAQAQKQTEVELQEQAVKLEEEITDRQATQESLQESEEKLQEQNHELQATEEMLRVQLGAYEISRMQLKESNSTLQAIFDVSPLPILISSYADGTAREVNRTFCNTFGYGRDKVIGMTGFDLGLWSDVSERQHAIRTLGEKQGLFDFPAEIRNGRGDVRSIRMYSTTIDFKNEPCLLNVLMDVTDQKRAEDELRQAQKMDVVGQLAGGVAHDFNNMLTAIIGSAEMMERHVKDNPAQAKLLKAIQEAAGRSAALTGQLLAFSRKGGTMAVHIWINKAVQSAIGLLERTIDKNIRLETRLTATNDLIIGDPAQLQNALLNLGINARDAMPDGGTITYATDTVFLDAAYCGSHKFQLQPGYYVEISVSDTGTGIKKEIIEQIFEPFFTTKGIGKGTGLGLAAVYGTVKEHQGSVSVCSEPGVGTVFKLYFPLAAEQNSGVIAKDTFLRGSGGILLVDDELLIREMGQALLEEHGYQVFLAADGEEALEVYERERDHISLVILDVVMPVMGGKETLRRLTAAYPDIKVLISSGFRQDETNDSFIALGARGFIQKPYHPEELFKALDDAMRNSG
ncbi:MAG: response regulator [Desulfuromonadaceae bacterium]